MESPLASSPAQARQTREQFANNEDYLSFELGKAVKELPPLYLRLLAGGISLLFVSAVAWAHFSKIDEVATAPGQIVPSEGLRPLRALGDGLIREVKVEAGDKVKKGDTLLLRDQSVSQAEVKRLQDSAQLIGEDLERLEAERRGEKSTDNSLQNQLLTARLQDFEQKRNTAIAEAERQQAAIREAEIKRVSLQDNLTNSRTSLANAQINLTNAQANYTNAEQLVPKAEENLRLAQERENSFTKLLSSGAVPRVDYLEAQERVARAESELIRARDDVTKARDNITNIRDKVTEAQNRVTTLQKEIVAQEQKIRQAQKAFQAAQGEANRLGSQRQSEVIKDLNQRREEKASVEGQLKQATEQQKQETLAAPFNGTVYAIKATQGPVQAGEELLSILPEGEELLLEVKILNRDIGFIQEGFYSMTRLFTVPYIC